MDSDGRLRKQQHQEPKYNGQQYDSAGDLFAASAKHDPMSNVTDIRDTHSHARMRPIAELDV
jgi:hypothetical protein